MNFVRAVVLLPAALPMLLWCSACSSGPQDGFPRHEITRDFAGRYPEFGEGLEGRLVNGQRIYTVMVMLTLSKEGKVTHAEVLRSDAPERMQRDTVKALKSVRYPPPAKPGTAIQTVRYNLKVKPG